jgi:ferredoxin-NADP reductase
MRVRPRNLLPSADAARGAAARLTTPLLPDDYLSMVNPLWSARELRGRVEKVIPETEDAATLVIKPGWGWSFSHEPGQYVGIAVEIDGTWHWRSYSLTSVPKSNDQGHISVTVKAMPEGFLSRHLVEGLETGTVVRLAQPAGEFVLPDPPPAKMLFLTAGSGVTPVMGMLRTLHRRGTMPDVVVLHSARNAEDSIFHQELTDLSGEHDSVTLHEQFTDDDGRFEVADIPSVCPDWRDRQAWACGPEGMLDAAEEFWEEADLRDCLHLERFSGPTISGDGGEGGHVTFRKSGIEVDIDGATTLMEAGENEGIEMPYGCRMGICHTCVVPLVEGVVRDLRSGADRSEPNEPIQTCVTAAAGDCVLDI